MQVKMMNFRSVGNAVGSSIDVEMVSLTPCVLNFFSTYLLPYHTVLEQTRCESIEATVMERILLHAGQVVRMNDDRLPNIVMRGVYNGGS